MPDKSLAIGQCVFDGRRHGHIVAVNEANYRIRWENGGESWKPHDAVQPANIAEKQKVIDFLSAIEADFKRDFAAMGDNGEKWRVERARYTHLITERFVKVYEEWNADYAERHKIGVRKVASNAAAKVTDAWECVLWYTDLEAVSPK